MIEFNTFPKIVWFIDLWSTRRCSKCGRSTGEEAPPSVRRGEIGSWISNRGGSVHATVTSKEPEGSHNDDAWDLEPEDMWPTKKEALAALRRDQVVSGSHLVGFIRAGETP